MVKNLTLPFSPATLISYETGTFPLSDDVCGIYLMVFAQILYDLVTLIFDLLTSAMSDEFSCMHPTQVPVFSILRLSIPELWVTQSDNITVTWNCHCACAVSRDMCIGVAKTIYSVKLHIRDGRTDGRTKRRDASLRPSVRPSVRPACCIFHSYTTF